MDAARDVPFDVRPVIEARGLGKRFGGVEILSNISFDVAPGEIVALIGPSGCGKSTLLNILSGLMTPDAGTFSVDGQPHDRFDGWRRVAYMFQEDRLLPWRTVRANVGFGLEAGGTAKAEANDRVEAVLRLVGLEAQAEAWPHQLSGGMRSRVALARSLVVRPSLLLMDEPFSKLDPATRSQMHAEVLRIQSMLDGGPSAGPLPSRPASPRGIGDVPIGEGSSMTIVFVTHDMEEAVVLADRIVLLAPRPGRIVDILPVDLPRPRVPTDAAVAENVRQLRLRT